MQGGPEERGLIRGRERKEFSLSFLPSPPRDKASSHHEMYFLEHSLSPRGKGHTMRKKKIPMSSVAGKEESNSYRSLPESSNFLLENNVSSILANVAYITCIYIYARKNSVSSLEILGKRSSEPEQMFEENLATRTRVSTKRSRALLKPVL